MYGDDLDLRQTTGHRPKTTGIVALMLAVALGPNNATAQIPRSQLAAVSQNLAGTQIDIVYRRPSARGRELFGALVPWNAVWTPSADSAVQFTISNEIQVNGEKLAAGSYSIWARPGPQEWEFMFNAQAYVFHLRYSPDADVMKVKATPEVADPPTETLTFYFAAADADSATLRLQWGRTSVPLKIRAKRP